VKPVRGLPQLFSGGLPPERRLALAAAAALFLLIGGMAWYQLRPAPAPALPEATGSAAAPAPETEEAEAGDSTSAPPGEAAETVVDGAEPAVEALAWPLSGTPRVVKAFGSVDESLGDYRLYNAVALEATPGQPVFAAAGGRVAAVEEHPVDGTVVVLDHGDGRQSRYAGLAEVVVAEGDSVSARETIGYVGQPVPLRRSFGPHLAFSLLIDGEPVDPELHIEP